MTFAPTFMSQFKKNMNTIMRKLIIPLTFLILGSGLQAQTTIWPGDVNNNGVVNNIDIIYWAYGKNTEGPARSNISTGWEEQSLDTLWATEFTDGTNLAFADCNGDGKVDEKDLQVIKDNFNFCRPIASGEYIQKADASCDSILFYQPVLADTTDNEQPKTDELFGAAFTFQFDPDVWAEKGLVSCNQITVDSINHEN